MEITDQRDALWIAAENGHLSEVRRLVGTSRNLEMPLNAACRNGHIDVVWELIENGADIHNYQESPLRWAAYYNRIEIVGLLLRRGADVHANHEHALAIAAQMRHTYLIDMLISWGARPTRLVILTARHYGNEDIARRLERIADGNIEDATQP